jgi:hypothetical protein
MVSSNVGQFFDIVNNHGFWAFGKTESNNPLVSFQLFQKTSKTTHQSFTKEMMLKISPLQFFGRIVGVDQNGVFDFVNVFFDNL